MRAFSKKVASLVSFSVELIVYAAFVTGYFLLVLHFLGDWIKHVYYHDKTRYAFLAVGLISAQGVVLERLTHSLMRLIQTAQAIFVVLRRLGRPHETITRPKGVPGLLVFRFASPLFFFNADYFTQRVEEVISSADPPVTYFLLDAEAIIDMDMIGVEALEELARSLKNNHIELGLVEVKGHFRKILLSTGLPHRAGFNIYPSMGQAVREAAKNRPDPAKKP
ncbi:MAG: sodium-independent anion transporter [Desulfobaccales bacterium]